MPRQDRGPIERRRRAAARVALYGAVALVGGALWSLSPALERWYDSNVRAPWLYVDWAAQRPVQLLREYVQIDTTHDRGNEIAGAEFLARQLRAAGIEPVLEVMGGRHANLWAVIEGEEREALVLHNHIDTDPLWDVTGWKHPPHAAAIEPPWLFGRGVFDMKSVTIAQLLAFLAVHEAGRPRRSLVFLATGSEEVGSELGAKWILRHRPALASRFGAVLTEGGGVEALTDERIKYWGIDAAQRGFLDLKFCAETSSQLSDLAKDIWASAAGRDHYRLTPEVAAVWQGYAETRTLHALQDDLGRPQALLGDLGRLERLPPFLRSMLRDEIVVGTPQPAQGGGYDLRVVLQLLPGTDVERAFDELLPAYLRHGQTFTRLGGPVGFVNQGSDPGHALFGLLRQAILERHPEIVVGPYLTPFSATDARYFRGAGIPSFGFSPFLIFSTDTLQVGKPNERMSLPAFVDGVELYETVVERATG